MHIGRTINSQSSTTLSTTRDKASK
jgi:hypothetical protein